MGKPGKAEVSAAHAKLVALYQATIVAMLSPSPEGSNKGAELLEEAKLAASAYGRVARESEGR